jgi:hypothetical protein
MASMRASFQIDRPAIEAKMQELFNLSHGKGAHDHKADPHLHFSTGHSVARLHPDVAGLVEKIEQAQWARLPQRPSDPFGENPAEEVPVRKKDAPAAQHAQGGAGKLGKDDAHGAKGDDDDRDSAADAEVEQCMAHLNFVRWLCGLPNVRLNQSRRQACNIVGQVVLARQPVGASFDSSVRVPAEEFAGAVQEFLKARGDQLSLLHCESSLIKAVEESLRSTHIPDIRLEEPPAPFGGATTSGGAGDAQHATHVLARQLAARVEAEAGVEDTKVRKCRTQTHHVKLLLPDKMLSDPERLPAALAPLRVFWDLQPPAAALPGQRGDRDTLMAASAPTKESTGGDGGAAGPSSGGAAGAAFSEKPGRRGRRRGKRSEPTRPAGRGAALEISSMWGDLKGAVSFRRRLLNPTLSEFGVARFRDTCVLWTGADKELDQKKTTSTVTPRTDSRHLTSKSKGNAAIPGQAVDFALLVNNKIKDQAKREAVCYPPPGIVPQWLIAGWRSPWTIMPDSNRFQPTAQTRVRVWRVRVDRPGTKMEAHAAERISEVAVKGLAVDCSAHGEPFCVIFWPEANSHSHGGKEEPLQLEVCLSGLCGASEELYFFYEIVPSWRSRPVDANFYAEAARLRTVLGEKDLWEAAEPSSDISEMPTPLNAYKKRSVKVDSDDALAIAEAPPLLKVSHWKASITTNSVDLSITLLGSHVEAMRSELLIIRFSGEEELVPRATQVHRLFGGFFLVRIKLPMARCRYELRFTVSSEENPSVMVRHPLKYTIGTGDSCQTLLSSMEDPFLNKFGYPEVKAAAHLHGIILLAPSTYRIVIGQCYFLAYVDKAQAVARATLTTSGGDMGGTARMPDIHGCGLDPIEEHRGFTAPMKPPTTLFSERLLPGVQPGPQVVDTDARGTKESVSRGTKESVSPQAVGFADGTASAGPGEISRRMSKESTKKIDKASELHNAVRAYVEPQTQDSRGGEVHLDLVMHNGACVHRLREREDFPGFYEGLFHFSEEDALTMVKLAVRIPRAQASIYAPRALSEWLVCRPEHFPLNF